MTSPVDRDLLDRLGLGALTEADADELLAIIRERLDERSEPGDPDVDADANYEVLCAELAEAVPAILHVLDHPASDEHDPWRHRRPDPSPTLLGQPGNWCVVLSPLARVVLSLDPTGRELYGRSGSRERPNASPTVVLRVPDGHRIDPRSIWCSDDGEVRACFGPRSDLRWRLNASESESVVPYTKVLRRRRLPLRCTDERIDDVDFSTFGRGRWVVTDGQEMHVRDRLSGFGFDLEALHDGAHSNAVNPHFAPDGSQLVALFNADDLAESGAAACSIGYFDAVKQSTERGTDATRSWEFQVRLHDHRPLEESATPLEQVGYDASSTRVGILDQKRAHLFHIKAWAHLGSPRRPDGDACVETVHLPVDSAPVTAWAGQSVLAHAGGKAWRVDLRVGAGEAERLPEADHEPDVVCAESMGDAAVIVHRDRTVTGVDAFGVVRRIQLAGEAAISAATVLRDGRLLVATASSLEVWSGSRLAMSVPYSGPDMRGLAPCLLFDGWALGWSVDGSVTTLRLGRRTISADHESIPHAPGGGFVLRATDAVMVDVDDWYLLGPSGSSLNRGRRYVTDRHSWTDVDAHCLAYIETSGTAMAGTDDGIEFVESRRDLYPRRPPVLLDGRVERIATGLCPRSLVASGDGTLWFVRLLT